MTLFDLLFLASALGCVMALIAAIVAFTLHRWIAARRMLLGLGAYLLLYALALVAVSALTPQQTVRMGQRRCFDDWCIAAVQATQTLTAGPNSFVLAHGRFTLVTVRVTNAAQRVTQREYGDTLYLLDSAGHRYDVSLAAQRTLDAAGLSGQPLDTALTPGASFTHTAAFETPPNAPGLSLVITHAAFPGAIVIGDDESFFHRPTLMLLEFTPPAYTLPSARQPSVQPAAPPLSASAPVLLTR